MDARVMGRIQKVVQNRADAEPKRVLDVGGRIEERLSLLRFGEFAGADRWCLNLDDDTSREGINHVTGTANDMHMFDDASFDVVLCNATLEHDKHFWLSVAEMQRVLAPQGLLVIGVPGFVKGPRDSGQATPTHRVHFTFDYYRFSRQAVREVFFEGMDDVRVAPILHPPRLIGSGIKPVS